MKFGITKQLTAAQFEVMTYLLGCGTRKTFDIVDSVQGKNTNLTETAVTHLVILALKAKGFVAWNSSEHGYYMTAEGKKEMGY